MNVKAFEDLMCPEPAHRSSEPVPGPVKSRGLPTTNREENNVISFIYSILRKIKTISISNNAPNCFMSFSLNDQLKLRHLIQDIIDDEEKCTGSEAPYE